MFGAVFEIPFVYLWLVAEQSMYFLYHFCVGLICLCSNLLSLLVSVHWRFYSNSYTCVHASSVNMFNNRIDKYLVKAGYT